MTNVVMPQMGESIAEGTIVRWIKKVGDTIDRDEPLFEISTDKVDAEIPSPAAGVLTEIKVKEGETVAVNSVVATIELAGEIKATGATENIPESAVGQPETDSATAQTPQFVEPEEEDNGEDGPEDLRRQKSSPLVRRIAQEHNVDLSQIHGTGLSGRVTKQDILGYIQLAKPSAPATAPPPSPTHPPAAPQSATAPAFKPGENVRVEPMSVMRKKIAEHMVLSAHTSPHVYSVYEVNFGRVATLRDKKKAEYEAGGARLTFTAFIAKVAIDALRQFPIVNASLDGDNIVYKKDTCDQRPRKPRTNKKAQSRGSPIGHVHDYQSRNLRRVIRPAADQSAAGGNSRRWQHRQTSRGCRRCDCDSAGVPHHAWP
jgi:pyruvate dehydrogenase E2 component (dihydrolipoamide acetyltransferase)